MAAGLTAQLPGLQIIASGDPRELTIWAKPSQHEVVTRILDQLKRDVPTARKPILAVYPITKVDAAGVQTVLAELFPDAQITLDEKASRLLIKAVAEEQKAIDAAVQQLDTDSPVSTKIKLMAYPVDGLTSRTVVAAIEAEVPGLSIIPDTAAETLIVRGQLRDHEKVAAIIDALRSSAGTLRKRRVVAYPAVFGTPSQTVVFFRSAFSGAQAVVDSTSRRMTVWATDEQHKAIAAAVAEMSGQGEMAAVTKSYPMKGLNATTLTRMLTQAVPDAKFAIDTVDSRLVAWAREADQKTIESIITGATDADHAGRVLQIFEVEPTRLTTTQTVLTNANPDVTFTAAATGNALLAWTSEEQATQIRETIKQLETSEALSTKRELRTFSVKDMNADSARSMLANVFPTVSFLDSPDGASLIANVTARDAKAIEETLGQLKANGIVASKRTMNFYDFKDIGGAEARALIAKAVPNVVFTGAEDRTVAWVLPGEHEKITTLLEELRTTKPFDRGRTLKAYSVRGLGSSASTVLQQAAPDASVVVGAQPEQYLIRATADEHEKLAETLQQLRTMADSEPKRELKTYSIKGLDAAAVRATLSPLVDGDVQLTVDPTGQQLYVRAFPEKQRAIESVVQAVLKSLPSREGEVTRTYQTEPGDADEVQEAVARLFPNANFAVDREYRVLLATALPEEHKTIESVVQQMSQSTNRKRGVAKTYPIGEAEGGNLAISIQRLYRGTQVRVSYDDAARTLLVVAEDDQHAVIQKLIDDLTTEAANAPVKELATFNIEGLDGKAVQETLRPLLVDEAEVTVDPVGRRLFINAFPEQQKRIATIVQSVLEGLPS
ncbi:MAG: hypothetical protein AB8G99_17240, partial [Planctomycetaceae bacterium]